MIIIRPHLLPGEHLAIPLEHYDPQEVGDFLGYAVRDRPHASPPRLSIRPEHQKLPVLPLFSEGETEHGALTTGALITSLVRSREYSDIPEEIETFDVGQVLKVHSIPVLYRAGVDLSSPERHRIPYVKPLYGIQAHTVGNEDYIDFDMAAEGLYNEEEDEYELNWDLTTNGEPIWFIPRTNFAPVNPIELPTQLHQNIGTTYLSTIGQRALL